MAAPQRRPTVPEVLRRVLVVDDDPGVGARIQKTLTARQGVCPQAPFDVDVALTGVEAKDLVIAACEANRPYSLAFVDMRLHSGWDGVETIAHLWEVDPPLRIVIYTASYDFRWDQVVEKLGRSDGLHLLRKPLPTDLIIRTAEALTRKSARDRRESAAANDGARWLGYGLSGCGRRWPGPPSTCGRRTR